MTTKYEPTEVEKEVRRFWKKNNIYQKVKEQREGNEKFYFLDGPPYASGVPHPGTVWNRVLKDSLRRYKWMEGYDVWDQPGFDCHGLPVENEVEQKFDLETKEDIKDFGEDKFIKECKKFVNENIEVAKPIFKKFGEWATWENPYKTMNDSYIEGVWWALKQAKEKGLLYKGKKVLPWCPRCGTALASNYEVEYETMEEDSYYIKFPVKDKKDKYLIIWTTTPWTIPLNLAVMANPGFKYAKVKYKGEIWVLAAKLVPPIMGRLEGDYEVLETISGKELKGLEYKHPLSEEVPVHKEFDEEWAHKVVLSGQHVDLSAGTGLVHSAPGAGPEDYEVGMEYDLPAFSSVDESGIFNKDGGKYKGNRVRKDDEEIVDDLKEKGYIVRIAEVSHEYPICERCSSPLIFRPTTQWFIKATALQERMLEENKKMNWVPDWVGSRKFKNWLENIRDWCVTRQRFWGTPFPLWKCDCGNEIFIGSKEKLKELADELPKELHKPWVDEIEVKCPECGKVMKRHPDVLDVWFDAGSATFSSLNCPQNKKKFRGLFPADCILESHQDQVRGWFYVSLVLSTLLFDKGFSKNIYNHGFMVGESGKALSKRLNNYDSSDKILRKYGADVFRFYMVKSTKGADDLVYSKEKFKRSYRQLNILWNIGSFLLRYLKYHDFVPKKLEKYEANLETEDRWILSEMNSTLKEVERAYSDYELAVPPRKIRDFFLDLSRNYIKIVRDRLVLGSKESIKACLSTLNHVYLKTLKSLAPVCPFITEKVYQRLKQYYKIPWPKSIHLNDYPRADVDRINKKQEERFDKLFEIQESILAARDKAQIKLRQPMNKAVVVGEGRKRIEGLKDILKNLTNVKKIELREERSEFVEERLKFNYETMGPKFGDDTSKVIEKLRRMSNEAIKRRLDKGEFKIKVNGEEAIVEEEDINFVKKVPERYTHDEGRDFDAYLDTKITEELRKEGNVRSVERRIQELRKKAELKRSKKIRSMVIADDSILDQLREYKEKMKKVTGSLKMKLKTKGRISYPYKNSFRVEGKEVRAGIKIK